MKWTVCGYKELKRGVKGTDVDIKAPVGVCEETSRHVNSLAETGLLHFLVGPNT